jgi:oligoribonuclease NrnB/cAMP/cGMP phosphodiesterase (DHH superfamily)
MSTQGNNKTAVIYHANCWDGLAAAWVVDSFHAQHNIKVDWIEGFYQKEPNYELLAGYKLIYIVDFSFPPDVLDTLSRSSTVIMIDHHKSAKEKLVEYSNPEVAVIWDGFYFSEPASGAVTAWHYFYSTIDNLPKWIQYIGDRDVWAWKYGWETKAFAAALQQYPTTKTGVMEVEQRSIQSMLTEGEAILAVFEQQLSAVKENQYIIPVMHRNYLHTAEKYVPCVNAPHFMISELLNQLAKRQPFAVGWYRAGEMIKVSLRSDKDDPAAWDVSTIAKGYGGGGHKNAAGFEILAYKWEDNILYGDFNQNG